MEPAAVQADNRHKQAVRDALLKGQVLNAEAQGMMNLPPAKCACGLDHAGEEEYKSCIYNDTTGSLDMRRLIETAKRIGPAKTMSKGAFAMTQKQQSNKGTRLSRAGLKNEKLISEQRQKGLALMQKSYERRA